MLIEWSQTAEDDIAVALAWFMERGEVEVGQRIATRIFGATDRLMSFPHSGRLGAIPGTRELVLPDLPYFLVYSVAEQVNILRVIHTSSLWSAE